MRRVLAVGTENVVAVLALELLLLQEALAHIRHLYVLTEGAIYGLLIRVLAAEDGGVKSEFQVFFKCGLRNNFSDLKM